MAIADIATIPAALADVALIDVKACAAARGVATSTWLHLVSEGKAPQPVIRGPRSTRWRLADVKAHLIEQAIAGTASPQVEAMEQRNAQHLVKARARRAENLGAKRAAKVSDSEAAEA